MNRRGFTLVELLAVIIIIGLLSIFIIPNIIAALNNSKEASYTTLLENIVISSQTYYEECEYGNLSDTTRYGTYACTVNGNRVNTTLSALANTGFLKVTDTKVISGKEVKVVLNPKNDYDMSNCPIVIEKIKTLQSPDEHGITNTKITYKVTGSGTNCPTTSEYEGVA